MKKTYLLIALGFLIAAGLLFFKFAIFNKTENKNVAQVIVPSPTISVIKDVDYKARFAIYTNGLRRVFTAPMYHNLSPHVYIESSDPSVVHVKKDGKTWMDFFLTLPMKLDKNCIVTGTKETFCTVAGSTLKFYLNGVKKDDLLTTKIKDGDLVLISYGKENETQIKSQLDSLSPQSSLQTPK